MKMVYCDVVFAANLSADATLLFMCAKFFRIKPVGKRIAFSSVLGGLVGIVGAATAQSGMERALLALVFAPVLCRISFGRREKRVLLKLTVVFVILGMCLGGFVFSVASIFSYDFGYGGISVWLMFAGMALMSGIFIFFGKTASEKALIKTVCVKISHNGISYSYNLLCDSGNLLTDPYSMLPVIVLKNGNFLSKDDENEFVKNKMRFIPINTASGKGLIKAMHPEKIEIIHNGKSIDVDAIVAFSEDNASFADTDGIIPYNLVEFCS